MPAARTFSPSAASVIVASDGSFATSCLGFLAHRAGALVGEQRKRSPSGVPLPPAFCASSQRRDRTTAAPPPVPPRRQPSPGLRLASRRPQVPQNCGCACLRPRRAGLDERLAGPLGEGGSLGGRLDALCPLPQVHGGEDRVEQAETIAASTCSPETSSTAGSIDPFCAAARSKYLSQLAARLATADARPRSEEEGRQTATGERGEEERCGRERADTERREQPRQVGVRDFLLGYRVLHRLRPDGAGAEVLLDRDEVGEVDATADLRDGGVDPRLEFGERRRDLGAGDADVLVALDLRGVAAFDR